MKNSTILKYALLMLFSACIPSLRAQTRVELSLKQCLQMAVANDQRVRISAMETDKLRYQKYETMGAGLPQVNASGSFQDFLKLPTQLIPGEFFGQPGELIPVQFGTNYNVSGGIQISQMVYNQSYFTSVTLARKMLEQGNLDYEKQKQAVVYDVAQLYYLALLTSLQIELMNENLLKLDTLQNITKIHYEKGFLKKVDLDRIVVSKMNMASEISNMQVMLYQQLNMIKYFTGLNITDSLMLTETITDATVVLPGNLNTDNHITLRMLDKQKEMTRVQINLSKAQYIPSLSLFGDFSYNNQQNDFGKLFNGGDQWLGTSLIGLSLNVPIFSGLQRYYRVKQNKIQYNQIVLSRDQTKKLIDIEVKNAADKLYNSKSVADAQFANMQLATDVYKVVGEQYNQGMAPLTDLLNAGSALISAQSAYTHALVQLKIAELEVFKSTGNLLQILN